MAYNPGISYRGEMLGQAIGQAGQGIAQAYGQGLQLKEEQKRYDDMMKQRRRDRKQLKKSYAIQAELLGVEKDDVETMGLGELQGFVEGTRMKQSFDFQALKLKELEDNIAQTGAGKKALGQMQMYITEQNLDPIEAATMAATDHGLELGEASKLVSYATTGQKLGLELRTIQARERGLDLQASSQDISRGTLKVQEEQVRQQREELEERKNPKQPKAQDVEGAPGFKVINMGGGKTQLVKPDEVEPEDTSRTGGLTQQQIGKVLSQLRDLKAKGETEGSVSKSGIVKGDSWWGDTDIDELIQKYELMQTGQPSEAQIRRDAKSAIDGGADPEAVKKAVKERYGIDL
jgi:hypothetical protein